VAFRAFDFLLGFLQVREAFFDLQVEAFFFEEEGTKGAGTKSSFAPGAASGEDAEGAEGTGP
jgi:hypothetical protein